MGMIACYQMVDAEVINRLKEKEEDEIFEAIEELQEDADTTLDIDKMWDGLHFLLTGVSATEPLIDNELSKAVVGDMLFSEDEDADFIAYTMPESVASIVSAMDAFDIIKAVEDFKPQIFAQQGIYPDIWMHEDKRNLQNELTETFQILKCFYQKTAEAGKGILVSIY